MDTNDVIDTLNDLIQTSKNGEYGFRTCAEHAQSPQLKASLLKRAESCASAAQELQQLVIAKGGTVRDAETGGSVAGALHRGWTALRGAVAFDDDKAMLDECERGEDVAVSQYRDALQKNLPADVRAVVEQQFAGVRANHDQIKAMRNQLQATTV